MFVKRFGVEKGGVCKMKTFERVLLAAMLLAAGISLFAGGGIGWKAEKSFSYNGEDGMLAEWAWALPGSYDAILPKLNVVADGLPPDKLALSEISFDSGFSWYPLDLSSGRAELPKILDLAGEIFELKLRTPDGEGVSVWLEPDSDMAARIISYPSHNVSVAQIAIANWNGGQSFVTVTANDSSGAPAGITEVSGAGFRGEGFGYSSGSLLGGEGAVFAIIADKQTTWPLKVTVSDENGASLDYSVSPRIEAVNTPPVAWPTETIGAGGWNVYTNLGTSIKDVTGNPDCSRGASVSGAVDISRGDSPYYDSCLYAYDSTNSIFFYRVRVDGDPLTPNAKSTGNGTGSNPWANNTWNLLIDLDGDGWKEFNIVLAGDSGGGGTRDISVVPGSNDGDDLRVYYNNSNSQCVTVPTISNNQITVVGDLVWWGNAATQTATVPGNPAADGATWNFGRSRCVVHTAANSTWGAGYFVDFQFPIAACTDSYNNGNGGTQLLGAHTPITFGYTTSASNSDPLQKDFASSYCYTPSCGTRFPYSDALILSGGIVQAPIVGGMTISAITCPTQATVKVEVADALAVDPPGTGSGTVVDTIASVTFQYYYDANGNNAEDDGSAWTNMTVVGSSLNPDTRGDLAANGTTASFNDWGVVWNSSALSSGRYLIRVIAVDNDSNSTTKTVGTYNRVTGDCYPGNITWQSYLNAIRTLQSDSFAPSSSVYMRGDFAPVTTYNVAFYDSTGARIQNTAVLSQSFGSLEDALVLGVSPPAGTYHALVYPQSVAPPTTYNGIYNSLTNPLIADDTFVVTGGGCTNPSQPVIGAITDSSGACAYGISIPFTSGSPATSHDLYVDGSLSQSGITSPASYTPADASSHSYVIRAINGACYTDSAASSFSDTNNMVSAPVISSVTDVNAYLLTGVTITWGAVSGATGYDLLVDGTTTVSNVASPYVHTPGDSNPHTFQIRAKNASCNSGWSSGVQGTDQDLAVNPPAVNGPLTAGGTAVTGTSTAPDGSTVTVYVDGVPYTGTVTGGIYSVSVPALDGGDQVYATVTYSGDTSDPSATATVDFAAPVVTGPIYGGATSVSGTCTSPVGTTITVYVNGAPVGTTTVGAGGNWTMSGIGPLVAGESITATAGTGDATSAVSAAVIVTPNAPTVNGPLTAGGTVVTGTSDAPNGSTVTVYVDGVPYTGTVTGGTYSVPVPALDGGDQIYATVTTGGQTSSPTATQTVDYAAPAVTGPLYGGATSVTGTSTSPAGTTITVYVNGVSVGTTTVGAGGTWTMNGVGPLTIGESITATAGTGAAESTPSAPVIVSAPVPNPPTVNGPLTAGGTTVTGTSDAPDGSTVTVYIDGVPYTGTVTGGTYSVTVPPLAGGDSVYATVTTAGGTSTPSATVTVDFAPPSVSGPIFGGATSVSGTSTSPAGTTVTVYVDGVPVGTTTVGAGGTWSLTGIGPLTAGESVTAITGTGEAASVPSVPVIVTAAPVQSIPPIVSSPIYAGGSVTVTGSSIEPPGSVITVYVDGVPVGTTNVQADGTWSLTGVAISDGQTVTATVQAGGEVTSGPSSGVDAASNSGDLTPPPFVATIYGEDTDIDGTSAAPNSVIDVYADGTYIGTTVADGSGNWVLVGGGPLPEGTLVTATATASPTGTSVWSAPTVVGGIIHILRSDKVTSLTSYNPNNIFIRKDTIASTPAMDAVGANHYYNDGEGALQTGNGSSDDDDFYLRDVHQPVVDTDPTVLTDSARPLVFYELIDNGENNREIFLSKDGGVITITWTP